jgi:hypothetical protein
VKRNIRIIRNIRIAQRSVTKPTSLFVFSLTQVRSDEDESSQPDILSAFDQSASKQEESREMIKRIWNAVEDRVGPIGHSSANQNAPHRR